MSEMGLALLEISGNNPEKESRKPKKLSKIKMFTSYNSLFKNTEVFSLYKSFNLSIDSSIDSTGAGSHKKIKYNTKNIVFINSYCII